jgi:hypothetical protein
MHMLAPDFNPALRRSVPLDALKSRKASVKVAAMGMEALQKPTLMFSEGSLEDRDFGFAC